jgi:hypothetical protein
VPFASIWRLIKLSWDSSREAGPRIGIRNPQSAWSRPATGCAVTKEVPLSGQAKRIDAIRTIRIRRGQPGWVHESGCLNQQARLRSNPRINGSVDSPIAPKPLFPQEKSSTPTPEDPVERGCPSFLRSPFGSSNILLLSRIRRTMVRPQSSFLFGIRNTKQSLVSFLQVSWTMHVTDEGGEEWIRKTARTAAVQDTLRSRWT